MLYAFFSLTVVLIGVIFAVAFSLVKLSPTNKSNHTKNCTKQSTDSVEMSSIDINNTVNVQTFKYRLAELHTDKENGAINDSTYNYQKTVLERQLLQAQQTYYADTPPSKPIIATIIVFTSLLTFFVYFTQQNNRLVMSWFSSVDKFSYVADELMTGKIDTPPPWAIADKKNEDRLLISMQANAHTHADDASRWMRLADRFIVLGVTDSALQAMERAIRLEPNNADYAMSYVKLSYLAYDETLTTTARNALLQLLDHTPNHQGALMLMVMAESKAGNLSGALDWVYQLKSVLVTETGQDSTAVKNLDVLIATMIEQGNVN